MCLTPPAPFTYAKTRRLPPHLKHASTSRANVLRSSPAQSKRGVRSVQRLLHRRGKGGALLFQPRLRPCLRDHQCALGLEPGPLHLHLARSIQRHVPAHRRGGDHAHRPVRRRGAALQLPCGPPLRSKRSRSSPSSPSTAPDSASAPGHGSASSRRFDVRAAGQRDGVAAAGTGAILMLGGWAEKGRRLVEACCMHLGRRGAFRFGTSGLSVRAADAQVWLRRLARGTASRVRTVISDRRAAEEVLGNLGAYRRTRSPRGRSRRRSRPWGLTDRAGDAESCLRNPPGRGRCALRLKVFPTA